MKRNEISYPCVKCIYMRAWSFDMGGDHDYACIKKPPSKYGEKDCDDFEPFEDMEEVNE